MNGRKKEMIEKEIRNIDVNRKGNEEDNCCC